MQTSDAGDALPIRRRLMRMAAIAIPVSVAVVVIFVVTGVGGFRGGWLWAPVIAGAALAPVGWFGWGRHGGRVVATATVALGGIALGMWNSQAALLSHGRLRAEMDSIAVPASFVPSGDLPGGWSLCFDECTYYQRDWIVVASTDDAQAMATEAFAGDGFALGPWDTQPGTGSPLVKGHRGRLGLTVIVDTRRVLRGGDFAALGPGQVGVTAILDTFSAG